MQALAQGTRFYSDVDQDLTIKSVAALPLEDNVAGIYANALNSDFRALLEADHQWTLVDVPNNLKIKPQLS